MQYSDSNSTVLECSGVAFSNDSVQESDRGRVVVKVPRSEIESISLEFGVSAERPFVQAVLGSVVLFAGFYPCRLVYEWLKYGGTLWDIQVMVFALVPIGFHLVYEVAKKVFS